MPFTKKLDHEYIKVKLQEGATYGTIAEAVGCTKQRVHQLARKWGIFPLQVRRELRNIELYKKYKDKWGNKIHTPEDLYKAQRTKFFARKANSKQTGYEWLINFGDIEWPTHCPVLGLELDYFAEYRQENSVSFDRIDPNKGYIKGNVVIMSWRANRIKNDGTAEEHRQIADYLDNITLPSLA